MTRRRSRCWSLRRLRVNTLPPTQLDEIVRPSLPSRIGGWHLTGSILCSGPFGGVTGPIDRRTHSNRGHKTPKQALIPPNQPLPASYRPSFGLESSAVWTPSRKIWTGSVEIWTPSTEIWAGSMEIWTGSMEIWTGFTQIWTPSTEIWSGSIEIWTGSTETWTGSTEIWTGSTEIWTGNFQ